MANVKEIFDKISSVGGKKDKIKLLTEHKDNDLLKRVLYLCKSPRVNFHIKKIPEPNRITRDMMTLEEAVESLSKLSSRELTGTKAINHLAWILGGLNPHDAAIIERIIGRSPKIGMDSSINKVFPKLIEETPYMGAQSYSEKGARKLFKPTKSGEVKRVYSQVKADGTYRNAIIQDGVVELLSRQGETSYLKGTKFLKQLTFFRDCVLNGELTIDGFSRTEANGMVSSMMSIIEKEEERGPVKTAKKIKDFESKHGNFNEALQKLRFTVWDMITIKEYNESKSDRPYYERLDNLKSSLVAYCPSEDAMISLVETKEIFTFEEAMTHFLDTQKRGLEGTILKAYDGLWVDTKPAHQIKMKLEINLDLRLVGVEYGEKGKKNEYVVSTLNLESSCGLLKTNPSGMNEAMMIYVTDNQDDLMGCVVQIRCCGLSQNSKGEWSTQHPSIDEIRSDKDTCDSLEDCKKIEEMAKCLTKEL